MSHHWWTWVIYSLFLAAIVGIHAVWFSATLDPTVGMRFGTALIALGIVVTARPFFRTGLRDMVDRQSRVSPLRRATLEPLEKQEAAHKAVRHGIVHDVVAERIVGVAFIFLGTLFNGYGDLPLRWMWHIEN